MGATWRRPVAFIGLGPARLRSRHRSQRRPDTFGERRPQPAANEPVGGCLCMSGRPLGAALSARPLEAWRPLQRRQKVSPPPLIRLGRVGRPEPLAGRLGGSSDAWLAWRPLCSVWMANKKRPEWMGGRRASFCRACWARRGEQKNNTHTHTPTGRQICFVLFFGLVCGAPARVAPRFQLNCSFFWRQLAGSFGQSGCAPAHRQTVGRARQAGARPPRQSAQGVGGARPKQSLARDWPANWTHEACRLFRMTQFAGAPRPSRSATGRRTRLIASGSAPVGAGQWRTAAQVSGGHISLRPGPGCPGRRHEAGGGATSGARDRPATPSVAAGQTGGAGGLGGGRPERGRRPHARAGAGVWWARVFN